MCAYVHSRTEVLAEIIVHFEFCDLPVIRHALIILKGSFRHSYFPTVSKKTCVRQKELVAEINVAAKCYARLFVTFFFCRHLPRTLRVATDTLLDFILSVTSSVTAWLLARDKWSLEISRYNWHFLSRSRKSPSFELYANECYATFLMWAELSIRALLMHTKQAAVTICNCWKPSEIRGGSGRFSSKATKAKTSFTSVFDKRLSIVRVYWTLEVERVFFFVFFEYWVTTRHLS